MEEWNESYINTKYLYVEGSTVVANQSNEKGKKNEPIDERSIERKRNDVLASPNKKLLLEIWRMFVHCSIENQRFPNEAVLWRTRTKNDALEKFLIQIMTKNGSSSVEQIHPARLVSYADWLSTNEREREIGRYCTTRWMKNDCLHWTKPSCQTLRREGIESWHCYSVLIAYVCRSDEDGQWRATTWGWFDSLKSIKLILPSDD